LSGLDEQGDKYGTFKMKATHPFLYDTSVLKSPIKPESQSQLRHDSATRKIATAESLYAFNKTNQP